MVGRIFALSLAAFGAAIALAGAERPYFPPQDSWERRDPAAMGLDAAKLAEAVAFAKTNESAHPRDFSNQERVFGRPLGPLPAIRGRTKGLIVYRGYIVAEWGDTTAVEPTFSAAKSFLSTLAGVASDRGLIRVDEPVARTVRDGGYDSAHNGQVTWAHHLWQTSEWEGELWGKPHTFLGEAEFGQGRRQTRELKEPGSHYEYNDVRINRLALSLLRVFGKPLPEVLREAVMDPIGASGDWRYLGYENSFVELGGRRMQSVTGGTRWGGGLWIGAEDQARFGLLFLRGGMERQEDCFEGMDEAGTGAEPAEGGLRVPLVAQSGPPGLAGAFGEIVRGGWVRVEHDLGGPGAGPCGGLAVARWERIGAASARGGGYGVAMRGARA
jgi:CubicO group peptidase (beta-lactamase class C family)